MIETNSENAYLVENQNKEQAVRQSKYPDTPPEHLRLIERVKTQNDSDALKELIRTYSGICYKVFHNYMRGKSVAASWGDLCDEKDMLIYNSVSSYDPSTGSTFAWWVYANCIYHCKSLNRKNKMVVTLPPEEVASNIDANYHYSMPIEDTDLFDELKNAIFSIENEKVRTVLIKHYLDTPPKTIHEITKEMGCSRYYGYLLLQKGLSMLRRKVSSDFQLERQLPVKRVAAKHN